MCESYGIFICWALALKFVCEFVRLLLNIVLVHPFFCTYDIDNIRLLLCLYFLVNISNRRQVCKDAIVSFSSNIIGTKTLHIYEGASFWKPNTTAFFTRHERSIIVFTKCFEVMLGVHSKSIFGTWTHYVAPDRTPSQITIFISIFIVEWGGFFTTSISEAGLYCVNDLLTDIHFTYLFERQRGPLVHSAITSSWETWRSVYTRHFF